MNYTPLLCNKWNSFLLSGFFLITLGTIALSAAFLTTMASLLIFGWLLVAAGLVNIAHSFWAGEWKGFFMQLSVGIVATLIGWLLLAKPDVGAASITLLIAIYFISSGFFRIVGSLFLHEEHWVWALVNGMLSLTLGVLIVAQWPSSALWFIGVCIGADLITSGWVSLLFSLKIRHACKVSGILSNN